MRLLFILLLLPCFSFAQLRGTVIRVHDGDTFTILTADGRKLTIRLAGIDCPELSQPYGRIARSRSIQLLYRHQVVVDSQGRDRYGRIIGTTYAGARNVNNTLLQEGLAWHYTRYDSSTTLANMQLSAQQTRRGLWQQPTPQAPWLYRFNKRRPYRRYNMSYMTDEALQYA